MIFFNTDVCMHVFVMSSLNFLSCPFVVLALSDNFSSNVYTCYSNVTRVVFQHCPFFSLSPNNTYYSKVSRVLFQHCHLISQKNNNKKYIQGSTPKFLNMEIWVHVRISRQVEFCKVTPLSMHALGHPLKPRDHGARPH